MDLSMISLRASTAPLFDFEEYEKLREEWARKAKWDAKPGEYECPVCGNKRIFLHHRENVAGFGSTPCICQEICKNWNHIRQSGMEDLLQRHSFENYRVTEPWQTTVFRGAQEYAAEPRGWILLAGQSGAGKTHLCSAICRILAARRLEFRYMPWREEIMALKGLATDYAQREQKMERLRTAPYLFIDDLFKAGADAAGKNVTRSDLDHAFELLNYRYNKKLPTIISTELYPAELEELDEALHGRILERCGKHVYTIKRDPARNHRVKAAG